MARPKKTDVQTVEANGEERKVPVAEQASETAEEKASVKGKAKEPEAPAQNWLIC